MRLLKYAWPGGHGRNVWDEHLSPGHQLITSFLAMDAAHVVFEGAGHHRHKWRWKSIHSLLVKKPIAVVVYYGLWRMVGDAGNAALFCITEEKPVSRSSLMQKEDFVTRTKRREARSSW